MKIVDRIRRSVANRSDDVFLRREFERFGSPAQVSRALAMLTRGGLLVRLALIWIALLTGILPVAGMGNHALGRQVLVLLRD